MALARSAVAGLPIIVASDDANNPAYSPPNNNWSPDNGGFGYNAWTQVTDVTGGGTYMDGASTNNRGVPANPDNSFALFAGSGSGSGFDISRPLVNSITGVGEFDIFTRFDVDASKGLDLVNLRTGNSTTAFGAGELLSFGIVGGSTNSTSLKVTDGSGVHTLAGGNATGAILDWNIDFNTTAGTYSLTVTQVGGALNDTITGNLEASNTSVGSFAIINSDSGGGQNLVFNDPVFSVPEPATWLAGFLSFGALAFGAARRRNRSQLAIS